MKNKYACKGKRNRRVEEREIEKKFRIEVIINKFREMKVNVM